jgi:hypothetical protein
MMIEDVGPAPLTDAPPSVLAVLLASLTERMRPFDDKIEDLLAELKWSLASGGAGVDREPAAVMRDLDDKVGLLRDFVAELDTWNDAPDWDARVRAIATENGGFCAITFYACEELSDLEQRACCKEQLAGVHLRAIWRMIKGLETIAGTLCRLLLGRKRGDMAATGHGVGRLRRGP